MMFGAILQCCLQICGILDPFPTPWCTSLYLGHTFKSINFIPLSLLHFILSIDNPSLSNQAAKNPRLERRNKFVTFTVDLQRDGGPLGLTLATEGDAAASGSDRRGPIFISALMEDGLAERTKTVQVGDQASDKQNYVTNFY